MQRVNCHDKQFELFISNEQIQERLKDLCQEINETYKGKKPIFVGILNGVFRLAGDVFNYIDIDCEVTFVKLKSYVGTKSGELTTLMGIDVDLEGRDVILMEDIVDTGKTMYNFIPQLKQAKPASINILTLLSKPDAIQYEVPLKYVGFAVPNNFLIGYGLDYNELGRHYNDIYKLVTDDVT